MGTLLTFACVASSSPATDTQNRITHTHTHTHAHAHAHAHTHTEKTESVHFPVLSENARRQGRLTVYFSQEKLSQRAHGFAETTAKPKGLGGRSFAGRPAQSQAGKALLITGLKNPFPF